MDLGEAVDKIQGKVEEWITDLIVMLPNFLVAVLVLLGFIVLAKIVRNLAGRLLDRLSNNHAISKLIASLIYLTIVLIGTFIALGVLNLDKTVTSLLAGAGIVGLAIGFAFQDTFANFIAGVIIAMRRPFGIGDIIESNDYFGTVNKINLRATIIHTPQAQTVIIPNKSVLQNPIKNYSELGMRRIDLEVGVSYGDDLEKVMKITTEAIAKIEYLLEGKDVELYYTEFGDSSINFVVRYWIIFKKQKEYLKAVSDGIMNIKKAFDENDITIPFPIRTLDFGIKGGEKLYEVWPENNGKTKNSA